MLGLAVSAATMLTVPAYADPKSGGSGVGQSDDWTETGEDVTDDGTVIVDYERANGQHGTWIWFANGKVLWLETEVPGKAGAPSGDPGPDDSSKGTEPINVAELIAKGKVKYQVKLSPESTPLGKWLDSEGAGVVPHWYPGDDGDNKGPGKTPTVKLGGPTAKQKAAFAKLMNELAKQAQSFGASMGDVADSSEEAPSYSSRGKSSGKNNSDGPNPNNNGKNKYLGSGFDTLGPHPELVNPPHSTSRGSVVTGHGLLDGDAPLSTNGPSGAGTAIGGGGSSRGAGAGIR
jgi:hypothetical protein